MTRAQARCLTRRSEPCTSACVATCHCHMSYHVSLPRVSLVTVTATCRTRRRRTRLTRYTLLRYERFISSMDDTGSSSQRSLGLCVNLIT